MNGLKLFGHPLHAAVVHFPVAAWTSAVVTDAVFLANRGVLWWRISFWLLAVGTATALGAMTAGFLDLLSLPEAEPAQKGALHHMYVMCAAWSIFAIDLLVRFLPGQAFPSTGLAWGCMALTVAGFLTLLAGTHLGARLVYDFGVGRRGRKVT